MTDSDNIHPDVLYALDTGLISKAQAAFASGWIQWCEGYNRDQISGELHLAGYDEAAACNKWWGERPSSLDALEAAVDCA